MTTSVNRLYLPAVDYLRGLAALLVLLYHGFHIIAPHLIFGRRVSKSEYWPQADNPLSALLIEGHSGVGLFIVLSGFILSLGAIGHSLSYAKFVWARVLRIYPMLFFCLALAMMTAPFSFVAVMKSILPLNVGGGVSSPFVAMFWAVAVEFQCYLIFPLLLWLSHEYGSKAFAGVVLCAIALRIAIVLAGFGNPRDISYWTVFGRIDQFCIGMFAARMFVFGGAQRLSGMWLLPAAILPLCALFAFNKAGGWPSVHPWKIIWPTIEGGMWAFFMLSVIAAGHRLSGSIAAILKTLGEISYSTYLLHYAIILMLVERVLSLQVSGNGMLDALTMTVCIALPITVLIGLVTYRLIEEPFLRRRPRYIRGAFVSPPSVSRSVAPAE